jgi:hypothetical protein
MSVQERLGIASGDQPPRRRLRPQELLVGEDPFDLEVIGRSVGGKKRRADARSRFT